MKVLVLGAAGFIGRNMVSALKRANIDLVASDIVRSPFNKEVDYMILDITDREAIFRAVKKVNHVFYLSTHPLSASIKDPLTNAKVNIIGGLNVLDAAKEHNIECVIFSSASSVVGEVLYNPVDEEHPCKPKTPYAITKLCIEHYLRVYHELYGLNYLIFRLFNVYGPYQYPESGALIPNVIVNIAKDRKITVFGDGSIARDYTYVDDVTRFYIKSILRGVKNETVNLGTGKLTTIREVINLASKMLKKEAKIEYMPPRPGEVMNFSADTKKLKKLFGEAPSITLEEGLRKTYEWLRSEGIV
ncbi:MAG: NAD-dependent epimerase/dehydratase family protein [Candidatus Bathyarchaeia archaeon]